MGDGGLGVRLPAVQHTLAEEIRDLIIKHLPDVFDGIVVSEEGENIVG